MPNVKPRPDPVSSKQPSIDTSSQGIAESSNSPQSPTAGNRRKKHATVACLSCKQLRSKCDEKQPCSNCARVGRQCIYDQTKDARRREFHGRALDELQAKITELESVINILRSTDLETAQNLVQLLRDGIPLREILESSASGQRSSRSFSKTPSSHEQQNPYALTSPDDLSRQFQEAVGERSGLVSQQQIAAQHGGPALLDPTTFPRGTDAGWNMPGGMLNNPTDSQSFSTALEGTSFPLEPFFGPTQADFPFSGHHGEAPHVVLSPPPIPSLYRTEAYQASIPVYNVPARPWTLVIDDSRLVSHLVSAFFTWHQPAVSNFIVRDSFLADMVSMDLQRASCSRMLVNSVLSLGCFYTYNFDKPWDRQQEKLLANSFLSEAMRLWVEDDRPRITTVQALLLMNCAYDLMGRDKIGSRLFQAAMDMATHLRLHLELTDTRGGRWQGETNIRSVDYAECIWGIYNWQSIRCHGMGLIPPWKVPPKIQFPRIDVRQHDGREWAPYPMARPVMRSFGYSYLKATSLLSVILNDTNLFLLNECADLEYSLASQKANRLYREYQKWKSERPECLDTTLNLTPQNLILHMTFYFAVTTLCRPFAGQPNGPDSIDIYAANAVAEEGLRNLISVYRATHGWKSGSALLLYYLYLAALNAMEKLVPDTIARETHATGMWGDSFTICISGMWHLLPSWDLSRPLLRLIQLSLPKMGIAHEAVPVEAAQILHMFEQKIWKPTDPLAVQSDARWVYPVLLSPHLILESGALPGMGDILRHWEGLPPDVT